MRRRRYEGSRFIELLIVIIIIGILAAIAIPMFLNQRSKAKDAAVKGGTHSIEVGLATYGHGQSATSTRPPLADRTALVDGAGRPAYVVHRWPDNPWTGDDMIAGPRTMGDYSYTPLAGGRDSRLAGHMSNDDFVVPCRDLGLAV